MKDEEDVTVRVIVVVTVAVAVGVVPGVWDPVRFAVPDPVPVVVPVCAAVTVGDPVLIAVTDPVPAPLRLDVLVTVLFAVANAEFEPDTLSVIVGIFADCVGVTVGESVGLEVVVCRAVADTVPVELCEGVCVLEVVEEGVAVAMAETDLVVDGEMVFVGVNEAVCVWVCV